jgi:CRISPR-associated protein Cas2
MTVLVLESVSESLRGECTRFLLEIKAGVFIGTLSALVREKLWDKVKATSGEGNCLIAYPSDNEQGFQMEMSGNPRRTIIDIEGLLLIKSVV